MIKRNDDKVDIDKKTRCKISHHRETFCYKNLNISLQNPPLITPCDICPSLPILALSLLPSTPDDRIWMARCETATCYLDKYSLQFEQIHFTIRKNTFCHLKKIHFVIWTNIFKIRFEWPGVRLLITGKRFATWTNTFCNWNKYILQSEKIHVVIWKKYILSFGQIHSR